MSYTPEELSDFWFGVGGSPTDIRPGSYVQMRAEEVWERASNDLDWAAILNFCKANQLFGFATIIPRPSPQLSGPSLDGSPATRQHMG